MVERKKKIVTIDQSASTNQSCQTREGTAIQRRQTKNEESRTWLGVRSVAYGKKMGSGTVDGVGGDRGGHEGGGGSKRGKTTIVHEKELKKGVWGSKGCAEH